MVHFFSEYEIKFHEKKIHPSCSFDNFCSVSILGDCITSYSCYGKYKISSLGKVKREKHQLGFKEIRRFRDKMNKVNRSFKVKVDTRTRINN